MTPATSNSSKVAESWDAYWRGIGEAEAWFAGGVTHPAILAFWDEFFSSVKRDFTAPSVIDIASGNGAVIERALSVLGDEPASMTCVDASESAIANIRRRFSDVKGVCADACEIPLDDNRFDVVVSQFGVEYAGPGAIDECIRLLATSGELALILHNESGAMQRECRESLDAIDRLQDSNFIELAAAMLRAGFDALSGADRRTYDDAAKRLAPAVAELESIMEQHGQGVAGNTIARVYSDVAQIHEDMPHYDPDEVLAWLGRMNDELVTYSERMSSMIDCAIDSAGFEATCTQLRAGGLDIERASPLHAPDTDLPLAWALLAAAA